MNFIVPYIGDNNPNWLIFFRGVAQPPTRIVLPNMLEGFGAIIVLPRHPAVISLQSFE
jgi:hypothetical protein